MHDTLRHLRQALLFPVGSHTGLVRGPDQQTRYWPQGDAKKNLMPSIKFNTDKLTTNTGAPVPSNTFSLRAGNRGPILLEDYHLLEKL